MIHDTSCACIGVLQHMWDSMNWMYDIILRICICMCYFFPSSYEWNFALWLLSGGILSTCRIWNYSWIGTFCGWSMYLVYCHNHTLMCGKLFNTLWAMFYSLTWMVSPTINLINWTHYYVRVDSITSGVLNNNFTRLPIEMQEMNWGKLVEEVTHCSWNMNLGSHISFASLDVIFNQWGKELKLEIDHRYQTCHVVW